MNSLSESDNIVKEPGVEYALKSNDNVITYINPFRDKFFKKIFASEKNKEVLRSFLNGVLAGRRHIHTITYGKMNIQGR